VLTKTQSLVTKNAKTKLIDPANKQPKPPKQIKSETIPRPSEPEKSDTETVTKPPSVKLIKKREEKVVAKKQLKQEKQDQNILAQVAQARQAAKEQVKQKQQLSSLSPVKQEGQPSADMPATQPPVKVELIKKTAEDQNQATSLKTPERTNKLPGLKPETTSKKQDQLGLAQTQRHLEMIEKFEQHFPLYQFIDGRYILYSNGMAPIESTDTKTFDFT